ncbi:hypothetical protein HU200_016022 [Digitaria exilis]|uniref:F-box domain-containing protein n=1 Tax=Digitaria exilis TaxID=1010633 RepID=A0A835F9M1_9POAL|nr:hypothetical protein HU200_016022 [Digitaria exilis]
MSSVVLLIWACSWVVSLLLCPPHPSCMSLNLRLLCFAGIDGEDCPNPKRSTPVVEPVASLPDDSIVEILSRVPLRSIHRFKCVSRVWRDLITNPLHRKRLPQTLEGFFYSDIEFHNGCADAPWNYRRHAHRSFISLPGRPTPFVDPSLSFLTNHPWVRNDIKLLDSCNGFLLFANGKVAEAYGTLGYIVCNPATKQWMVVPSSGLSYPASPVGGSLTYLLIDLAMSPHFHLVQIWQNGFWGEIEVRTYSSETGIWCHRSSDRRQWIEQGGWEEWVNGAAMLTSTMGSAMTKGMLRFVIFDMVKSEYQIAAVDREGKTCRNIPLLPTDKHDVGSALLIGQSQGFLHCVREHARREINSPEWAGLSVWVHKDQENNEWELKHKVFGKTSCHDGRDYRVLAFHPDHNMLFLVQHLPMKLISYDMDSRSCMLSTLPEAAMVSLPHMFPAS